MLDEKMGNNLPLAAEPLSRLNPAPAWNEASTKSSESGSRSRDPRVSGLKT